MKKRINPPSLLDGAKPSYLVLPHEKQFYGPPLLHFLCAHFPFVGEENWRQRLSSGFVMGADGVPSDENALFEPGKTMLYYRETSHESEPRIPFDEKILYINEHLLVVDKPHFLPVIPSGKSLQETLLTRLCLWPELQHLNVEDITPIHRLDKDTAGAMLFSLNPATRRDYQIMFQEKTVQKTYEAVAPMWTDLGHLLHILLRTKRGEKFLLARGTEGKPNTHTITELIENRGAFSLYRLTPHTEKKHQLRMHMTGLNMPSMSDALYPTPLAVGDEDYDKPLELSAKRIKLTDPVDGEIRVFESRFTL